MTSSSGTDNPARKNWAGNLTFNAEHFHQPRTIEELQEIVVRVDKLRALGSGHCFNNIADTPFHQASMENFKLVVGINKDDQTVTVEAGLKYGELCPWLHKQGYALHNLASLPHISIAGACATATHGSGIGIGNLAAAVTEMEMVNAAGEIITLSRKKDEDTFCGAVVGLGGVGIVTKLTLQVQPAFNMAQRVYLRLPLDALLKNFEDIMASGYSVSLFTDWQSEVINQVWIKRVTNSDGPIEAETDFYGAHSADVDRHPVDDLTAENCTDQLGIPGPWHERLPHFRMDFVPSSGEELQSEYFVPAEHAKAAIEAMQGIGSQLEPVLIVSELRSIAADDLWMSTCYQLPSIAFHFSWNLDPDGVIKVLPIVEEALRPFGARPHWGKVYTMSADEVRILYPKFKDFRELLNEVDPSGKFRNDFLQQTFFD